MTEPAAAVTPVSAPPPTRVRYRILGLLCGLSMITYLDRVCFGAAASTLVQELNLTSTADLKWAFTAFTIAYAVFEVPSGWLGDRLGPRSTLIRIVLLWSIFTALTGMVGLKIGTTTFGGLGLLILLRFLFGAGEAGAYPNITRSLHNWFPPDRWELAQGCIWMSGRLMGGLTPLIWAILVGGTNWSAPLLSWRGAFWLFGAMGIGWCLVFAWIFRDRPAEHPESNEAEEALIEGDRPHVEPQHSVDWKGLLTNRRLWLLCLLYSLVNYGWAFNITYLPSYLQLRFEVADRDLVAAVYKGAPLWVGAAGCLLGGFIVGWLHRWTGDRRLARSLLGTAAMVGCAGFWMAAGADLNIHLFCLAVAAAAFCVDLTLGAVWASCQDLGRASVGVAAAFMNTIGTLGAACANWLTGTLVEWQLAAKAEAMSVDVRDLEKSLHRATELEGYQTVFATYVVVYLIAAGCWVLLRPERRTGTDSPGIS